MLGCTPISASDNSCPKLIGESGLIWECTTVGDGVLIAGVQIDWHGGCWLLRQQSWALESLMLSPILLRRGLNNHAHYFLDSKSCEGILAIEEWMCWIICLPKSMASKGPGTAVVCSHVKFR